MESNYIIERRKKMLGLSTETKEKKPARIKPMSKKRQIKQREYRKIVAEMLEKDNRCKVKSPVCTGKAQGLHHKVKRSPANLTDINNLIPCCNACNLFLETDVEWGVENGFVKSKFKK